MYSGYFGMREPGFSITPDPQYLYLSERHREALAHLLFGTGEGGGFVLLTGEVGTGKTTVCRAFLEQLPPHVDVALVLNPALTAVELLQTVCEEFGIGQPPGPPSPRLLVEHLNRYLLQAHGDGRKPVLLIDEAQNLRPAVLEQIRLLTNLETAKHKLLQIFLVGQPELRALLRQDGLRQVAQRITARYHLAPLDAAETAAYVRHRLAVAGVEAPLFAPAALRRIHQLTGGVPRLVNILCDRALLGAYAEQARQVDRRIVGRAARELQGPPDTAAPGRWSSLTAGLLVVLVAGVFLIGYALSHYLGRPGSPLVAAPAPKLGPQPQATPPLAAVEPDAPAVGESTSVPVQADRPAAPPAAPYRLPEEQAMRLLLARWELALPDAALADGCGFARVMGLRCLAGQGGWEQLRGYDRPVMLALDTPAGTRHAVVTGLDAERVRVATAAGATWVPQAELQAAWTGAYLLLWRPAPGGHALIGASAPPEAVRWLRLALAQAAGRPPVAPESGSFDAGLQERVRAFQLAQGLQADGILGPQTLIRLNTAARRPGTPRLDVQDD